MINIYHYGNYTVEYRKEARKWELRLGTTHCGLYDSHELARREIYKLEGTDDISAIERRHQA